ncbi:tyrosine-type recombinase/integrase [Novosphingobium clariflavum]|uniref:Tyrosine-type recombinase/integrase n=1 Tax=Novosphingobium clariflavum TaxID=2029884 RepID=A0ABV6SB43_9SPHN|nr:site-specific integrase [Novosphingobium clariflavum]
MSIYEEKRGGVPTGRYRVEVTVNGQRRRKNATSLSEARRFQNELTAQLSNSPPPKCPSPKPEAPKLPTLAEARKRAEGILWFGQSTELESFRKLDRIISVWGDDMAVDAIDSNKVDDLIATLRSEGRKGRRKGAMSEATLNRYLSTVSAFLKFCKRRDLRQKVLPELEWRDEDEGRIRWLTYDEEDTLLELLPKPYDTMVYIAIRTGLRVSELIELTEEQVTPEWVYLWGTGTKSGKSRSVPINKELYDLLMPLVSEDGNMPDYWQLRNEWDKARAKMGLSSDSSFVFHTCRHSYATRAVQAGVNIRVLQKIMGHSAIQTTLRYAHVDDDTVKTAGLSALNFHSQRKLESSRA